MNSHFNNSSFSSSSSYFRHSQHPHQRQSTTDHHHNQGYISPTTSFLSSSNSANVYQQNRTAPIITTQHLSAKANQSIASRRLYNEIDELNKSPIVSCHAFPSSDSIFRWSVVIDGPADTLYEGGTFFAELDFSVNYPYTPPEVQFRTKIYHCNINSQGDVSLALGTKWKSTMGISTILQLLISLFYKCDPYNALVPQLAEEYLLRPEEYKRKARTWTQRYAS